MDDELSSCAATVRDQIAESLRYLTLRAKSPLESGALLLGHMICRHFPDEEFEGHDTPALVLHVNKTLSKLEALERQAQCHGLKMLRQALDTIVTLWLATMRLPSWDVGWTHTPCNTGTFTGMTASMRIAVELQDLSWHARSPLESAVLLLGAIVCRELAEQEEVELEHVAASAELVDTLSALKFLEAEAERHGLPTLNGTLMAITTLWMLSRYLARLEAQVQAGIQGIKEPPAPRHAHRRQ